MLLKLPDTGQATLSHNVEVDANDFQAFIDSGGMIYINGFQIEFRDNIVSFSKSQDDNSFVTFTNPLPKEVLSQEMLVMYPLPHGMNSLRFRNRKRFFVEPCDNLGSVTPPPPRDRTWVVRDRNSGHQVAEYDRRSDAREEATRRNAGGL